MAHAIQIEQLLEAGAHFGHLTRRWNPKMAKFIFTEKNGIHFIDLRKTQILIDIANEAIHRIASSGRGILFVGTKPQIKDIIEEQAKKCNQPYVCERWLGGMLTNFATIRKSIKRLNAIDKMEVDGTFEKITKKERLLLTREKDRLRKVFGGIEDMTRLPGALFIVDIKKEHIAVKEAKILGIPVIALVDTNVDPEEVDIPIPANDDSAKTVELIAGLFAKTIEEGAAIAKTHAADKRKEAPADAGDVQGDAAVVKRKLRKRKTRKPAEQKEETKEVKEEATTETKEEPKPEVKEQAETEKADNTEEKEN
jgi:small subunit ribosomal protein S2